MLLLYRSFLYSDAIRNIPWYITGLVKSSTPAYVMIIKHSQNLNSVTVKIYSSIYFNVNIKSLDIKYFEFEIIIIIISHWKKVRQTWQICDDREVGRSWHLETRESAALRQLISKYTTTLLAVFDNWRVSDSPTMKRAHKILEFDDRWMPMCEMHSALIDT